MASAVATQHIRSKWQIQMWDHDPGATTAVIVSADGGTTPRVVDCSVVRKFGVAAAISVLGTGGAITKLEIIASAASTMSSEEVIKDSGTVDADAVGDWLMEECTMEEVAHIASTSGKRLRYLAGRITMDAADAEAVAVYLIEPDAPRLDLTPATTIA